MVNPNYDGNWEKRATTGGMTLRDWFAGQALAGNCAADTENQYSVDKLARWSYETADAMLAERAKEANPDAK